MGFLTAPFAALWEDKPDVPDFNWTDLVQQQLQTAEGNLDVLPLSEQIGGDVNDFMRGERAKTLAGVPGLEDLETQTVENLKNWLRGDLGDDLTSAVNRGSNAKAFAGGYGRSGGGESGMYRNLQRRDLAGAGLGLQQEATQLANQYLGGATARRAIPEWNPASMFVDPFQAAQFNAGQAGRQFERDWLESRIDAQPEPWQREILGGTQAIDSLIGEAAGKVGGAAAGGGGMSY